jgi:quercetin dioxygenase-like cupin family protein
MTIATTIEARSTLSPDEVRRFTDKGQAEIVQLAGRDISRSTCEPGWRWSEHVKPIAQTDSCQAEHLGYCQQGRMTIRMDDGTETTISAGDVVVIPPGHDAWVEGDETCIFIDFGDLTAYAKPQ